MQIKKKYEGYSFFDKCTTFLLIGTWLLINVPFYLMICNTVMGINIIINGFKALLFDLYFYKL